MDIVTAGVIVHASKRKQECLSNGSVQQNPDMEALNAKKQRVDEKDVSRNGDMSVHCPEMQRDQVPGQMTIINDEKEIQNYVSEPMECTEEMNGNHIEVNGNKEAISNLKLCAHGHLNSCTTYNVPCRYPRMFCHPGGLMENRLQAYHGF